MIIGKYIDKDHPNLRRKSYFLAGLEDKLTTRPCFLGVNKNRIVLEIEVSLTSIMEMHSFLLIRKHVEIFILVQKI